ncbi:MAG TPA: LuxR C-terminal-related transcriptional regulator, partial [Thermoanaerobaculia bacterium]
FGGASTRRGPDLRARLTRREQEIVELVNLGLKNKIIAERLFITETTVRHHLTSIFNKLAVTSRLELMRYTYGGRVARAEDERERRP